MKENHFTEELEQDLRLTLKRCRPEVIEAAIDYRKTGNKTKISEVTIGIIERFLEPENRPRLQETNSGNYRLIEDLGIDSLVMVEIIMTIEEVLKLSIPNENLKDLSTINDVKNYIQSAINNPEETPVHANT